MHNTLLNLIILALLVFLFGSVDRVIYDRRIRFWLLGWTAVCIHLLLHLHVWATAAPLQYFIHTSLHLLVFTFVGLAFLLSFLPRTPRRQTIVVAILFAAPSSLLVVLCLAAPHAFWLICITILAGEVISVIEARRLVPPSQQVAWAFGQAIAIVCGAFMLLAAPRLPQIIPYLVLAQIFLAAASGLRATCTTRATRGCFAAIFGLASWAVALPLRFFVEDRFAFHASPPALWNLWDAPMFLTAFGMFLIVLEENLRRAAARSEDYRQLFDCHPLPMYIYNVDTLRFLRVNQAAIEHYGYSHEEFAAMTIEDIRPASELPRLRKVLEGERRKLNSTHGWRHTLKSGRVIDVDIHRHSLRFENQPCNVIVALDVTQRNAAEQRLRQTYKLESLGQLTGGIAHDFNNLLAILMGSLELVERENPQPHSRALIQQAILSVRRGAALTRRLLAYSRHQPVDPGPISVSSLVESMAGFLKTSVGPSINLKITFESGLWQAAIDPNQLENAVLNLTLNARDAMPLGGSLHLHACNCYIEHNRSSSFGEINTGDYVLLTLTDTGSGMPAHILARATEPFFTTKPTGEGTGLGLSMVQSFLKQSGGSLQIESVPEVGTTIQLYLPRANVAPNRVAMPEVVADQPVPRGSEPILLVEDDSTIRHLMAVLLRSLGYTVFDAGDGAAALSQLQRNPKIALLLTDVILPGGMDGAALAVRARTLRPEVRVLFSSGHTRDVLMAEGRLDETSPLLTKPYQVADLAQLLRQILSAPSPAEETAAL